jgi:TetR/AcrR family transcriptional repressor of lmrAB and yxaGH operons
MIEAASRLLRRDGYAATGLRAVVAEAGTPWGSAHHCFPGGKDELAAAAIRHGGAQVLGALEHALAEGSDIADAVRYWFALAGHNLAASDYLEGCPVAVVALEVGPGPNHLADACAAEVRGWTNRLAQALTQAGFAAARSAELATVIVSSLEGALLMARVTRSTSALTVTADAMATVLHPPDSADKPQMAGHHSTAS